MIINKYIEHTLTPKTAATTMKKMMKKNTKTVGPFVIICVPIVPSMSNSFNQVIYRLFHLICAANNIIKPKPPCIMISRGAAFFYFIFMYFETNIDWSWQHRDLLVLLCIFKFINTLLQKCGVHTKFIKCLTLFSQHLAV